MNFLENHILYFASNAIQIFLREHKAKYSTKDYEFFSALLVNAFCERQWGRECKIGFPISPDFAKQFSAKENVTLDEIAKIFRNGINQNSPVDFTILPDGGSAVSFQIKRFGVGQKIKNTQGLIDFLSSNKLIKLPTQKSLCLVITLDPEVSFEGREFKENFDFHNFRFGGLVLFGSRATDKETFFLQLFPTEKQGIAIGNEKSHQCDIASISLATY
ncbi:MAG: hypothetical protein NTX55_02690 [Candidatus Parcubacteria bacterium]|nr:hypothetical protein [Candidatus Parcubacteria bacterium]